MIIQSIKRLVQRLVWLRQEQHREMSRFLHHQSDEEILDFLMAPYGRPMKESRSA